MTHSELPRKDGSMLNDSSSASRKRLACCSGSPKLPYNFPKWKRVMQDISTSTLLAKRSGTSRAARATSTASTMSSSTSKPSSLSKSPVPSNSQLLALLAAWCKRSKDLARWNKKDAMSIASRISSTLGPPHSSEQRMGSKRAALVTSSTAFIQGTSSSGSPPGVPAMSVSEWAYSSKPAVTKTAFFCNRTNLVASTRAFAMLGARNSCMQSAIVARNASAASWVSAASPKAVNSPRSSFSQTPSSCKSLNRAAVWIANCWTW
mmetsp:Transcript_56325/g.163377  ORF Transcript_56325/g.163377 Transcript_56325/m.163377 type:complete len:263 (+) Transcript_56325:552-1340(+)